MSTKIEWTEETWNPTLGCRKVSAGCDHCYAMNVARVRSGSPNAKIASAYADLTMIQNGRVNWTGKVRELPDRLSDPFRWRAPRRVFVDSMSDLFHEDVSDGFIACVWDAMGRTPQHTYQILTKRPERMREWVTRWTDVREPDDLQLVRGPEATREAHPSGRGQLFAAMLEKWGEPPPGCTYPTFDWAEGQKWWPRVLPNVWLGVSIEDQKSGGERLHHLCHTPARVRFLSCEPLLGPLHLSASCVNIPWAGGAANGGRDYSPALGLIHWAIIGGESGPGARPLEEEWVRDLLGEFRQARVAPFVKQLGSRWAKAKGGDSKGGDWQFWPQDLRVREYPDV